MSPYKESEKMSPPPPAVVSFWVILGSRSRPEAKGRIERLWNTLQDRLPGELKLLGITDIDGANELLPRLIAKHNEKFAVLPAEPENVYVKPVEKIDMDFLFARRQTRKAGEARESSQLRPEISLETLFQKRRSH